MNFCAKIEIDNSTSINEKMWKVEARIIDNTGNFFPENVSVGNMIYLDGSAIGADICKYKVDAIISTSGIKLVANIIWDIEDNSFNIVEPFGGIAGIIGETTPNLKLINMPSMSLNSLDEQFITSVKNFENKMYVDKLLPKESPHLSGKPTVPKPDINSDDETIANTDWVTDIVEKEVNNIKNKMEYTNFIDDLIVDEKNPNIFYLKYIPQEKSIQLSINSLIYEDDCFTVDKNNKKIIWTFDEVNNGFNIEKSFEVKAIYDYYYAENNLHF